ncbi:MAG: type II secretion system protein [Candidatus Saccharimonadales bacterium]
MFKQKKSDINAKGFTIIEVLIVLAIAGLILLIVLLAIPALQRSQRNNARKSDAGHVVSAINSYVADNNGVLPGNQGGAPNGANPYTTWQPNVKGTPNDCTTLLNDAGTLGQYNTSNGFGCNTKQAASPAKNGVVNSFIELIGTGTMVSAGTTLKGNAMVLDESAQCPAQNLQDTPTTQAATAVEQAALLFTQENGGTWVWNCQTVQ